VLETKLCLKVLPGAYAYELLHNALLLSLQGQREFLCGFVDQMVSLHPNGVLADGHTFEGHLSILIRLFGLQELGLLFAGGLFAALRPSLRCDNRLGVHLAHRKRLVRYRHRPLPCAGAHGSLVERVF
jgi:hypothetical protein